MVQIEPPRPVKGCFWALPPQRNFCKNLYNNPLNQLFFSCRHGITCNSLDFSFHLAPPPDPSRSPLPLQTRNPARFTVRHGSAKRQGHNRVGKQPVWGYEWCYFTVRQGNLPVALQQIKLADILYISPPGQHSLLTCENQYSIGGSLVRFWHHKTRWGPALRRRLHSTVIQHVLHFSVKELARFRVNTVESLSNRLSITHVNIVYYHMRMSGRVDETDTRQISSDKWPSRTFRCRTGPQSR